MAGEKRRPRGRPATGKRPVIAMRIHPDLYEKIRAAAKQHKFSISEEAAHQLGLAFEWEATRANLQRLTTTRAGLEELMRSHGMKPLHFDQGTLWADGKFDAARLSMSIDAAAIVESVKPALTAALVEALSKTKGSTR